MSDLPCEIKKGADKELPDGNPPLFEPKFSRDENVAVDRPIELPEKTSNFEVYGQEQPEINN